MSWPTPSLLTKGTRAPRATTMSFGATPAAVMVIVVVEVGPAGGVGVGGGGGVGVAVGASGVPPPHETTAREKGGGRGRGGRLAGPMERGMAGNPRKSGGGKPPPAPG